MFMKTDRFKKSVVVSPMSVTTAAARSQVGSLGAMPNLNRSCSVDNATVRLWFFTETR